MYTLTVHEISLFPRLPIAFCEIPLNFVWKACRQSMLPIHSFTFCSMSRDTFHYRGETNQMWSYAPQRYDPYTHTTCIRRRSMVYYHIIWLASKSNSPRLASDQSTMELCIPASTCAHTNRTTCVRRRHFPWECTTNQIWRWQPSESPNIANPPFSFRKLLPGELNKDWKGINF